MASREASKNRNLVILRCGDASLHGCWLETGSNARNWDLHLSYFGSAGAPVPREGQGISWTFDPEKSKWNGIARALVSGRLPLDDYDYIATLDDDLILKGADLNRAFDMAREHDLAACQLSLYHDSFFGLPMTLRHPALKLHYTTRIELMAPIIRIDVFKRLVPYMHLPDNLWAMDHIVSAFAEAPRKVAVLDEVSVLHTRAFWTSAMYVRESARTGLDPFDVEQRFLREHGFAYVKARFLGGLTRSGRELGPHWGLVGQAMLRARLLRKWRKTMRPDLLRIATARDGQVIVMRRMPGAEGIPVDYRASTGLEPQSFLSLARARILG